MSYLGNSASGDITTMPNFGSTLYRPPTDEDTAKRVAAAQALPSPLHSAAANAARSAAVKATGSISGRDVEDRSAGAVTPPAPVDPSVAAWNAHVAAVSGQLGGNGVGTPAEIATLMNGPQPGWTKQAGEAAVNQTGGAPRMLNVGYGSNIVASGSGSRGQANNFVGVGTPTTPGSVPSALGTMRSQLADLNARQKLYSESGTMRGRLMAVALSRQAQRLSQQLYTEGMTQHAMGTLNLETQKAYPDVAMGMGALGLINTGDAAGAYRVQAVRHGQNPNAPHIVPGMPFGLITNPTGVPMRRFNSLTGQAEEADENGNFSAMTGLPGRR